MNGYAEILQEIERNNEELRNLNRSRDAIKRAEKDMPREEFQKELSTVERFLASEQLKLENNKNIIQSYDNAYFLINELERLNNTTEGIRDFQDRDERNAEIEAKRRELTANMQVLPASLQNELRNRILAERTATITPEKNNETENEPTIVNSTVQEEQPIVTPTDAEPSVEENATAEEMPEIKDREEDSDLPIVDNSEDDYDISEPTSDLSETGISNETENEPTTENNTTALENELDEARREYQESIARFQQIFVDELNEATNEGPFNEIDLENFNNKYLSLKVAENERMLAARNNIERLENEVQAAREQLTSSEDEKSPQLVRNYEGRRVAPEPTQIDPDYEGRRVAPEPTREDPTYKGRRLAPEPIPKITMPTPKITRVVPPHVEEPEQEETAEKTAIDNTPITGKPPLELPPHITPPALPPHIAPPALPPHVEPPEPTATKEPEKDPVRGFDTIIYELTKDLDVKKGDSKKYTASNIKVFRGFCDELQAKNTIYNIFHFVPAVIKIPVNLVRKLINKITYSIKDKQRIKELQKRIDSLSEADVETIMNEYKGSRVIQEKLPTILNVLLNEKIQKHLNAKLESKNELLERKYLTLINAATEVEKCNELLKTEKDSDKIKTINNVKNAFLTSAAKDIATVRNTYNEANALISGGSHGFEEDMRAAGTKMSRVGMSFAKDYDLDHELQQKLAELEQQENLAVQRNDNEAALKAFMARVELLSKNTRIENSIFGKRDAGKKVFLPLGGEIDYSQNPLVRDILTTLTVATAAVSAISALKARGSQAELENEIQRVNDANDKMVSDIKAQGEKLVGNREDFTEGMKAEAEQSVINGSHTLERQTLDETGWAFGRKYNQLDAVHHQQYNEMADQIKSQIEDVARQCNSGAITDQQALELIQGVANKQQQNLLDIYTKYQPILKDYTATHSFDLHGVNESMEYVLSHPEAILKMNEGMVESVEIGEQLMGLEPEHISAFLSLPSNLRQTLTASAAATVLAYNVARDVNTKAKARTYGNEVTDMVQEYIDNKEKSTSDEVEKTSGRSK